MHATCYGLVGGIGIGLITISTVATGTQLSPAQPAVAPEGAVDSTEGLALGPEGIDGVLLLRNKNLLTGRIARLGERYRVVEPGAVIFVPALQVWRCCPSREDAYAFLRGTHERLLARDHLELAQWCLRNELLAEAARELLDARTLQGDLPTLPLVERRLRQRLRLAAAEQDIAAAGTQTMSPPATQVNSPDTRTLGPELLPERQADTRTPVEASRVCAEFARRIQPMLVQSCTTSGCHTPDGAEQFKLDRLALAGGGHAELTRRNLAATLREFDLDLPSASRLYEYARRRHGQAAKPSTPLRRRQAALLLDWFEAASGVDPQGEYAAEDVLDAGPTKEGVVPASFETESPALEISPRDRFDPAIFNAQSP